MAAQEKLDLFTTRFYTTIVNPTKPTFSSYTGCTHCNAMVIVKNQYVHHSSSREKVHTGYPLNSENNNAPQCLKKNNMEASQVAFNVPDKQNFALPLHLNDIIRIFTSPVL